MLYFYKLQQKKLSDFSFYFKYQQLSILIIKFISIEMSQYRFLHQPSFISSAHSQALSQKHYKNDSQHNELISGRNIVQSTYAADVNRGQDETRKWGSRSKVEIIKNPLALAGRYQPRRILKNQNQLQKQQKKRSTSFYPQLQQLKKQVSKIIQYSSREQQSSVFSQKNLSECSSKKSVQSYFQKNKQDINPEQISDRGSQQKLTQSRRSSFFNYSSYDKEHYSQLKNLQLKTQLKNLKNKYRVMKLDYEEKVEALTRKNQYLEKTLKSAHQEIEVYKTELSAEMAQIRKKMSSQQQSQDPKKQSKNNEKDDDNQCYKQRISSLYNEIFIKNKRINDILIQLHDSKGQIQKKNYQINTFEDKQKHHQTELENIKKQLNRKQKYLQIEIQKNQQLTKKINTNNIKVQENVIANHTDIKQISNFDAKTHQQLEAALKNQGNLLKMIRKQNLEIQKLHKKQKQYQCQLGKINKQVQEKNNLLDKMKKDIENKQMDINSLNKSLDNARKNQEDNQILKKHYYELQSQFNQFKQNLQTKDNIKIEKQDINCEEIQQKFKLKDQQIQKWKIQYMVAKSKIDDRQRLQKLYKNRKIQTYYQQYMSLKSRNEIIQPKITELEEQNVKFMEKMKTMEINQLNIRIKMKNDNNALSSALMRVSEELQSYKMKEQQILNKSQQADKALQQSNLYRRNIQMKILNSQTTNEELKQAIAIIKNRISDQDEKLAKQFRQIKNKDSLISKLRTEVQQLLTNKQADLKKIQIKDIRQRVSEILNEQIYFVEQIKHSAKKQCQILRARNDELILQNTQMKNKIYFMEESIIKVNYEKEKLAQMYNSKLEESQKQEADLNNIIQAVTKNYNETYFEKNALQANFNTQLTIKDQKISYLSAQIKKLSEYLDQRDLSGFSIDGQAKQLQEINSKLKKQLTIKDDQLTKLRDTHSTIRTAHQNLKSELEVQKLKTLSEKKNLQISLQIQIQNLKNQVTMNEKKIISLIQKVEVLAQQNKKKDTFIQNYIIGKKLPQENTEFLTEFMKKYQSVFSGQNIGSKLKQDLAEIEKVCQINFNLLKEISTLKTKLQLYQKSQLIQMPQVELNKTLSTPYKIYRSVQAN